MITGGAGFIGSNLVEALLSQNNEVVCLDNFATGKQENIDPFMKNPAFQLITGDIRNIEDCKKAVKGVKHVLHQAALGSVPRSIQDPATSNAVNISGFLNMLIATRDEGIQRFIYAASSSTYGNHPGLPKYEDIIGSPLSPYAITKYVNELYANVFSDLYQIETIGLRYFNVFGEKQDPHGAYAAVIPKFVQSLIAKEPPVINGDGTHSRDFTYIQNVVQINQLAAMADHKDAVNTVFNVAYGENTNLNQLYEILREFLGKFDSEILKLQVVHGPERVGDVKHSLASIDKAKQLLGYNPQYGIRAGLEKAVEWYWDNLQ